MAMEKLQYEVILGALNKKVNSVDLAGPVTGRTLSYYEVEKVEGGREILRISITEQLMPNTFYMHADIPLAGLKGTPNQFAEFNIRTRLPYIANIASGFVTANGRHKDLSGSEFIRYIWSRYGTNLAGTIGNWHNCKGLADNYIDFAKEYSKIEGKLPLEDDVFNYGSGLEAAANTRYGKLYSELNLIPITVNADWENTSFGNERYEKILVHFGRGI